MQPVFRTAAIALVLCAAAACSKSETANTANTAENTTAAAPGDTGRGAMLNARADRLQEQVGEAVAANQITREQADKLIAEVVAARADLSDRLSKTSGPLPEVDRQAVFVRLTTVEDELRQASAH